MCLLRRCSYNIKQYKTKQALFDIFFRKIASPGNSTAKGSRSRGGGICARSCSARPTVKDYLTAHRRVRWRHARCPAVSRHCRPAGGLVCGVMSFSPPCAHHAFFALHAARAGRKSAAKISMAAVIALGVFVVVSCHWSNLPLFNVPPNPFWTERASSAQPRCAASRARGTVARCAPGAQQIQAEPENQRSW